MEKQFVAFKISDSLYCIDIMDVQEVVRESKITHMPNFPSFVEGVVNLRDMITPVLSIHKRLNLKNKIINKSTVNSSIKYDNSIEEKDQKFQQGSRYKLIIIKVRSIVIGLLVDSLDKILVAKDTDIQNAEGLGQSTSNTTIVAGILHINQEIYTVLNSYGILERDEEQLLSSTLN